ncbi:MAG TPA: hypothetical protein VIL18_00490 [Longimicrobiales bacterium]
MIPEAVIKVGGSLAGDPGLPRLLETLGELAAEGRRLVVVPGGGPFADAVRAACAAHDPGPSAAHWMAILAMDQYAHLLAARTPRAALVVQPGEVAGVLAAGRTAVLAPYAWLRAADPLPHGWDVTSDSIAAWVAARLGAQRLVLLKSVDGVRDEAGTVIPCMERRALGGRDEVDGYFARALEPGTACWIINGRRPERLRELLREGRTLGTELC